MANGRVKIGAEATDGVDFFQSTASKTRAGWIVGAGIERAFTNNITLKAEYLYTDLGEIKLHDDEGTTAVKSKFQTLRLGVNYKF